MNNNSQSALIGSEAPPDREHDQLLSGLSPDGLTSRGLGWTDYLVEELHADVTELEESVLPHASLFMWRGSGSGELKIDGGCFKRYIKRPGFLSFFPAGQFPAARTFTRSQFLAFAIRRSFMETLEIELDQRPAEKMRIVTGVQDSELRQLMSLLSAEAARGGVFGRLYADSLAQAIATRLLFFNEKYRSTSPVKANPLPRHLLKRVIERMRDLNADLDLRTLAAETGYSQRHFIRMFHAATGQTPHRYQIQLRLEHAKKLLRQGRTTLMDVAVACGFSSHSHLTHAFRSVLGVTPSEYRHNR